jgi:hypothetical protein
LAERKIDYDRGVRIRTVPNMGMDIFMYKDAPGVYLNAYGTEVTLELAKLAGFDVERLGKLRLRQERMAQMARQIDDELATAEQSREVVEELDGFKIISLGDERYVIEDPDGNVLTTQIVSLAMANKLLGGLVPSKVATDDTPPAEALVPPNAGGSGGGVERPRTNRKLAP